MIIKMKCLCPIFIAVAINSVFGQNLAFYDAKFIYESCYSIDAGKFKNKEMLYDILGQYFPGKTISDDLLNTNPFFEKYLPIIGPMSKGESTYGKLLSIAGGIDVTTISQGLSLFMIDRAKEELNIAFFDRLKTFFEKNEEIKKVFPATAKILENLIGYRYTEMLPILRSAFYDDLRNWPQNIDNALTLPKYADLIDSFPQLRLFSRTFIIMSRFQRGEIDAPGVIREFAGLDSIWNANDSTHILFNVGNASKFANILSESILNTAKSGGWVDAAKLKSLATDSVLFRIYLGLLYQVVINKNITFVIHNTVADSAEKSPVYSTVALSVLMREKKDLLLKSQHTFQLLFDKINKMSREYNSIREKLDSGVVVTDDDYYHYISAGIDIAANAISFSQIVKSDLDLGDYYSIAIDAMGIYENVYRKEYGIAVLNGSLLLSKSIQIVQTSISSKTKDGYNNEKNEKLLRDLQNASVSISKYGRFMANLVDAKSPEEVKNAIEAAALPVGSSAIKKYSKVDFCVQGYVGAYFNTNSSKWNAGPKNGFEVPYGVFAPVGLGISKGFGEGGSVSLVGTLIDIGAIVDYDLKRQKSPQDTTIMTEKKDYKIELGNIFSPGGYLVYGLPKKLPLAIGFGLQYGPGLAHIKSNSTKVVNNPSLRYTAFLGVDLPFFEIVNVPRSR